MKSKGAIAILGGMGPQASAKLVEVVIEMASRDFGVKDAKDFPEIILVSAPVPEFFSSKKNVKKALTILKAKIKFLNQTDIVITAVACNTAHLFLKDLQEISEAPFVSIIEAVTNQVITSRVRKVGLMASPSTIRSGLFRDSFRMTDVNVITPKKEQVEILGTIIESVIAGEDKDGLSKKLEIIALDLKKRGAQAIILGCTELPLAFPKSFPIPVFDSIQILSRALLIRAFNSDKKGITIN
ncbi:MAG TPA: amino acid racemase [Patescibacteria group bacterium]